MNKFKNNKEFYKSTFDDIHASDELLRKAVSYTHLDVYKRQAYQPRSPQGVLLAYAMGYLILESASRLDARCV